MISSSLQGEVGGVGEKGGVGDDLVIGCRKVKVIDSEILKEIDRQNNHEPSTAAFSSPTHDQRSQEEASTREKKSHSPRNSALKALALILKWDRLKLITSHHLSGPS